MRTYKIEGTSVEYPSVTTVLSQFYDEMYPNSSGFSSLMLKRGRIGTMTHALCSMFLTGRDAILYGDDEDWRLEYAEAIAYYNQLKPYLAIIKPKTLYTEKMVYSHKLTVAGTADLIISDPDGNGVKILDIKTTLKVKNRTALEGYFMQISAYAVATAECLGLRVSGAALVMAYPNRLEYGGGLELDTQQVVQYANKFAHYRAMHRAKHGN